MNSRKKPLTQPHDSKKIEWIKKLLQTPIEDNRKYCLWRILVPYLLNVRKLSEEDATKIMEEWLQKCDRLRKLDFRPKDKIKPIIKANRGYLPISFAMFKQQNYALCNSLSNK